MDPVARWIAVASLVVALACCSGTIHTWRRSGPRVLVDSPHGATPRDGMIWVEVRNVGRLPIRVTGIGLYLKATKPWPDGAKFPAPVKADDMVAGGQQPPWATKFQRELAATESAKWFFHLGQLFEEAARQSHLIDVEREYLGRPCVFLARVRSFVRARPDTSLSASASGASNSSSAYVSPTRDHSRQQIRTTTRRQPRVSTWPGRRSIVPPFTAFVPSETRWAG